MDVVARRLEEFRNRVTTKSNDFKSALGKKKQSNPWSKIGKHLLLASSSMTSSEAALPFSQCWY